MAVPPFVDVPWIDVPDPANPPQGAVRLNAANLKLGPARAAAYAEALAAQTQANLDIQTTALSAEITARQAAISALTTSAAADATSKANAARDAAVLAAASDATSKATSAQTAAISTAATDATAKVAAIPSDSSSAATPSLRSQNGLNALYERTSQLDTIGHGASKAALDALAASVGVGGTSLTPQAALTRRSDGHVKLRNALLATRGVVEVWEAQDGGGDRVTAWKGAAPVRHKGLEWIPGPGGNGWALKNPGSPDNVTATCDIPNNSAITLPNTGNTFTIAGLVNLHRGASFGGNLFQRGTFQVMIDGYRLEVVKYPQNTVQAKSAVVPALKDDALWHWVAVTCTGGPSSLVIDTTSTLQFWVDGAAVAQEGATTSFTADQSGAVGSLGPNTYASMSWQFLAMFNRALTATELLRLNNLKATAWR